MSVSGRERLPAHGYQGRKTSTVLLHLWPSVEIHGPRAKRREAAVITMLPRSLSAVAFVSDGR